MKNLLPPGLADPLQEDSVDRFPKGAVRGKSNAVILSEEGVRNLEPECSFLLAAFYGGVGSVVSVLSLWIAAVAFARMPVVVSRLVLLSGPLLLIVGSIWTFNDGRFGVKGLTATVAVLGYCAGISVASLLHRYRVPEWDYQCDWKREYGRAWHEREPRYICSDPLA